jgi:hypothetical protein
MPKAAPGGSAWRGASSKAGACYIVRLPEHATRKLKSRHALPFTLKIQQPTSVIRGNAVLRKYASLKRMQSAASRQLGYV